MFENFDQARDYVREHGIRMIDLKFCDLWGRWRHLTLAASEFTDDFMEQGVGFDGSSIGLKNV
ncbi:MAG: glutamine synthetase, partial [Chloroflexi bacterium]